MYSSCSFTIEIEFVRVIDITEGLYYIEFYKGIFAFKKNILHF